MPLGFVVAGMILGIVCAILTLAEGAGFGMAFLAYAVCGSLGIGVGVLRAMMAHEMRQPELPSAAS